MEVRDAREGRRRGVPDRGRAARLHEVRGHRGHVRRVDDLPTLALTLVITRSPTSPNIQSSSFQLQRARSRLIESEF